MKQVVAVEGKTIQEFTDALNETYNELSRFHIERVQEVTPLSVIIHYEIPDVWDVTQDETNILTGPEPDYKIESPDEPGEETVTIQITVGGYKARRCCECDNYVWGIRCPYREGHVRMLDEACPMFNVIINRG